MNEGTQFLYLHKFFFGGVTTFTAHLFHNLGLAQKNKVVLRPSNNSERRLRNFGYGLYYQNISLNTICSIKYPFLTVVKDNYFHALDKLNNYEQRGNLEHSNIILVIHDPRDITDRMIPLIKGWKIITIRETVQQYLKQKYDLDPLFLYHPFYPYPVVCKNPKRGAVSISRIGFGKNIDIILNSNKLINFPENSIKLYGCPTPMYVYTQLGGEVGDFRKYYCGKFDRSFTSLSNILAGVKLVVDLSLVRHDGGGTQYTFLEAIHNNCALILHRRWIEDVDPKYRDFKEGYNCFAIENEKELAELIEKDPDTTKIVQNAKKLMNRHINVNWSRLLHNS